MPLVKFLVGPLAFKTVLSMRDFPLAGRVGNLWSIENWPSHDASGFAYPVTHLLYGVFVFPGQTNRTGMRGLHGWSVLGSWCHQDE